MSPDFTTRHARWRKTYKGGTYSVTCSDLGLPEAEWTELGSYQSANEWWIAKRAVIDAKPVRRRPDVEMVLEDLRRKKTLLDAEGRDGADYREAIRDAEAATRPLIDPKTTFASLEDEIDAVRQARQPDGDGVSVIDPGTAARVEFLTALGVDLSGLDASALEIGLGSAAHWDEKFEAAKTVPEDRRLGRQLAAWFALKTLSKKPTSLVSLQGHRKLFENLTHGGRAVLTADMPVDVLTETKVDEVYAALHATPGDNATRKKKWMSFQNFVEFVAERRMIPLPLNLRSGAFTFSVKTKTKPKPVMKDVRDFVGSLPDRLRLYALLAANCGMNNVDIGKLAPGHIDFAARTLTRKRVKTEDCPTVPTVSYWLWDETLQLLRQEMAVGGPLALLDSKGKPLYIETVSGPKGPALYDKIKSSWRDHFGRGVDRKYTVKSFRFISSDLIKGGPHRLYWQVWLGQSPKLVSEKNYSSSEDCSEVCRWLRQHYFPG